MNIRLPRVYVIRGAICPFTDEPIVSVLRDVHLLGRQIVPREDSQRDRVQLLYVPAGMITWQAWPQSTITQAGKISGITIHGTASGTAGIHSGSIIGAAFEDLWIDGFTGSNSSCIWLDNVNGGWMERTVMSRGATWLAGNRSGMHKEFENDGH